MTRKSSGAEAVAGAGFAKGEVVLSAVRGADLWAWLDSPAAA